MSTLKKEDYSAVAVEAMEDILEERGVLESLKNPTSEIKTLDTSSYKKAKPFFSTRENRDFALKNKGNDGVYFSRKVMSASQTNLSGFVLAFGIMAIIFLVVFAATEMVEPYVNLLLLVIGIGFFFWWIQLLKKNKSCVRTSRKKRDNSI